MEIGGKMSENENYDLMIKSITEWVKKKSEGKKNIYGTPLFESHICRVVEFARQLAEKVNADMETVEVAAWMHDIGIVLGDFQKHHLSGANFAGEYLPQFNIDPMKILNIKHCITSHRADAIVGQETIEAQVLANANIMSQMVDVPSMFNFAYSIKKMGRDDSCRFIRQILDNYWDKLMPEAKELIRERYEAAKLITTL